MPNHHERAPEMFVVRVTGPAGEWQEWDLDAEEAGITLDRLVFMGGCPRRYNVLTATMRLGDPQLREDDDTQEWPRPLLKEESPVQHEETDIDRMGRHG